ncbi:MAG: S53 family peptidase [Candidatus Eremiobacteraeota bacterium]|nr:S53 family peptidase [Candidatus Eremiobacteraeota bacterium]
MRNVGIFRGGAVLAVLALLAACGGGGGGSSAGAPVVPIAVPTATPPTSASSSIPVGSSSSSVAIPSVGGVSGMVTVPAAVTGAGATLAATTSLVAPPGLPALLGHLRTLDTTTVYAYESFTPSATITFASSPAFSIALPAGTNMSQTFYAAIYSGGWDKVHALTGTVSAGTTTVNFPSQTGTYSLTGGTTYYFAFYGVVATVPTPSTGPSLPPSTPPTATPAPTATPTPTHAPTATPVPTNSPTPGPTSAPGSATCTSPIVNPPNGFGACDLQGIYNFPSGSAGTGQTVAIVDAYDDPKAEADLKIYRAEYGLPECSTTNGCFKKLDQNGGTSYPLANSGWIGEISLDLDMVSAVCPNCKIMLVEAATANGSDLEIAVDTAVTNGANVVSNSYGGPEDQSELTVDDPHYNHPGVAIVASSGDKGFINHKNTCDGNIASHECGHYPGSSPYVTAVGGTSLQPDPTSARPWTETAWSGAGSYCSPFEAKPKWQTDTGCSTRMVADVSAVADPATGVAVYDSTPDGSFAGGWGSFGGTSASAPIIGAAFALAGNTGTINTLEAPYKHLGALVDITSGNNYSGICSPLYFCTAGPGYDGPTGLGVPFGVGALSVGRHPASFGVAQNHVGPTQRGCAESTSHRVMACDVIMRTDIGGRFGIQL